MLWACQRPVSIHVPSLELVVPNNYVTAGNDIAVQIINNEKYQGKVHLVLKTVFTYHVFVFDLKNKVGEYEVDGKYLTESGIVNCWLMVDNVLVSEKNFQVRASDIADPIKLFTGPNSIWVNDFQETMVVALPKDKYGNAARELDSVEINLQMPDKIIEGEFIKIHDQLAFKKLSSGQTTGKILAGASAMSANSKEQKVEVVPLWPKVLSIEIVDHLPYADGRQFYQIKTNTIKDDRGNMIPDGTHVVFSATSRDRKLEYNSYTIDGVAKAYIRNPEIKSVWKILGIVGNGSIVSKPITIEFKDVIKNVPRILSNTHFLVGPIESYIGQYVPDGTEVEYYDGQKTTVKETEDGKVDFHLPMDYDNFYIKIAGHIFR